MAVMRYRLLKTFTGPFVLMQDDNGDLGTAWVDADVEHRLGRGQLDRRLLDDLADRLVGYFQGEEVDFADVALPAAGGAFTRRCWVRCRQIARGETISYAELASRAGSPAAARAAGQAMRHNRLPIIVPCHRVVGSSGALHGFGGSCDADSSAIDIKRRLLEMERQSARRTVRVARSLALSA